MRKTQFRSLKVDSFETDKYEQPLHSHTYYEIIYIFNGTGIHHINELILPYKKGDLFLISPGDEHFFEVKERTDFTYIKFNDSFFEESNLFSPNFSISFSPSYIMKNARLKETGLQFAKPYNSILRRTITSIRDYNATHNVSNSGMINFLVLSVFELIRETAIKLQIRVEGINTREEDLITYIHQHIYNPALLKVEEIASTFNVSVNYFSTYFSRNFGISYNQYLINYKLQLIEKRLAANIVPIKNIAAEFGFADLSHLNNFFKRHRRLSPSVYRAINRKVI